MIDLMKEYRVSSPYGIRKDPFSGVRTVHSGIDLVKPRHSPIFTFVSGMVIHAKEGIKGSGLGGYGNVVVIKDKKNHLHLYAHLEQCSVTVGEDVQQGEKIGVIGSTGRSTGIHLHYEVRPNGNKPSFGFGKHIDPVRYLDDYYSIDMTNSNKPTTKEEMKMIMSKYFKDIPESMKWVSDPADRLYEKGILKGDGKGNLSPDVNATRGEMIVLIDRLLDYVMKTKK